MKKRDKAIKDITDEIEIEKIICSAKVCHVAMIDGDIPYVLAFNFGFKNRSIILHSATEGKKIDILKKNPNVCISFDTDHDLFFRDEHVACSWRMRYRSVLVWGKVEFIEDYEKKIDALQTLMDNYSNQTFEFSKPSVNNIAILQIKIERWTGRSFEY